MKGPGTVALMRRLGIGAQHFEVAQLDRMLAPDRAGDARHWNRPAGAVDHGAGIFDVDAVERGGETVGIAFAALFAVADDVEPGALLVADGEDRGVVLRRLELVGRHQPQVVDAHPRHLLGKLHAVDQPFRLRIGADEAGGQEHGGVVPANDGVGRCALAASYKRKSPPPRVSAGGHESVCYFSAFSYG